MPFQMIRDDITRVKADAVVNTANPEPRVASGTDAAIYQAAEKRRLLAARKKIGRIAPGEAVATPGFRLPAKYIIHTVGPVWIDGDHGEREVLRACYRNTLHQAEMLRCHSIAFPLIATGNYGFPKEEALQIALTAIREHLENSDLQVTLVVFDAASYSLGSERVEQVESYIDDHYVSQQMAAEYDDAPNTTLAEESVSMRRGKKSLSVPLPPAAKRKSSIAPLEDTMPSEMVYPKADHEAGEDMGVMATMSYAYEGMSSLDDVVNNLGESFQARLLRMIDERGMSDPEVYKRANVDRKLFSKIRCSEDYIPKKRTILALAIALRLNLDDTRDLLASAGLLLTNNSKADVIIRFCIENGIYDIYEINALLFQFHQPILSG